MSDTESITALFICMRCGATKHKHARGLCKRCYASFTYYKDHEITRNKRRTYYNSARANNPQKYRAQDKTWRAKNPEKVRASTATWAAANPEKIRIYRDAHRDERNEKNRLSYAKHSAKRLAKIRIYQKANPEKLAAIQKRHLARKRGATICDFTHKQWVAMQLHYDHRCAYCGKRCKGKLTQDHITPVSKGGNHTARNIVPACRRCNCSKNNGALPCPVQPILLL